MPEIQIASIPEDTPSTQRIYSLRVVVNNIDRVIQLFDFVRVYRSEDSTDGQDGLWSELTDPGTWIAMFPGSKSYLYVDPAGEASFWYRITYYNSKTGIESAPTKGTKGVPSPALSIMSVEELKEIFLFGVDLTNDQGTPYPDALFQFYIQSAVQFVQDKLDITLPVTTVLDERQDFMRDDYQKFMWLQLLQRPVISIERLRLVLPIEQTIVNFDLSWVYPDKDSGHVEIIPGGGTLVLGQLGYLHPILKGANKYLPQAFRIDYTAGFETIPADIREVVGMLASMGPFNIAGDLIAGAGIASQSLSLDGISQSINTTSSATNAGYGARILQYLKQLKEQWPVLRDKYRGLRMVVV
jgi:hypothetical protein